MEPNFEQTTKDSLSKSSNEKSSNISKFIQNQLSKNNALLMRINNVQLPSSVSALQQVLPQEKKTEKQSDLCKSSFTDEPVLAQSIPSNANGAEWTDMSTTQPISSNSDFIQDQLIKKNALLMRINNLEKPLNGASKPIQTVLTNTKPDKQSVSRITEKLLLSNPLYSKSSVYAQTIEMVSEPLLVQPKSDFSEPSSATVDTQTTEMISQPLFAQKASHFSESAVDTQTTEMVSEPLFVQPKSDFSEPSSSAAVVQTIVMLSEPTLIHAVSKILESSFNAQTTEMVSKPLFVQMASNFSESSSSATVDAQTTEILSKPTLIQAVSNYSESVADSQITEMVSEPLLINVENANIVSIPTPRVLSKSIIKTKQKAIKRLQCKNTNTNSMKVKWNFKAKLTIDSLHREFGTTQCLAQTKRTIKMVYLIYLLQNFERFYVNQMNLIQFICDTPCIRLAKQFNFVFHFNRYRTSIIALVFEQLQKRSDTNFFDFLIFEKNQKKFCAILNFHEICVDNSLVDEFVTKIIPFEKTCVSMCESNQDDQSISINTFQTARLSDTDETLNTIELNLNVTESEAGISNYLCVKEQEVQAVEGNSDTLEQVVPILNESISFGIETQTIDLIKLILNKNQDESYERETSKSMIVSSEDEKLLEQQQQQPVKTLFLAPAEPKFIQVVHKPLKPPKRRKFMRVGLSKRQKISTHLHDKLTH